MSTAELNSAVFRNKLGKFRYKAYKAYKDKGSDKGIRGQVMLMLSFFTIPLNHSIYGCLI